jgi:hypothetical protein
MMVRLNFILVTFDMEVGEFDGQTWQDVDGGAALQVAFPGQAAVGIVPGPAHGEADAFHEASTVPQRCPMPRLGRIESGIGGREGLRAARRMILSSKGEEPPGSRQKVDPKQVHGTAHLLT